MEDNFDDENLEESEIFEEDKKDVEELHLGERDVYPDELDQDDSDIEFDT